MPSFARQLLFATLAIAIVAYLAGERRPDLSLPILYGVLGLFVLSTGIFGVWHTRRFGGGFADGARLIAALLLLLGLLWCVPLGLDHLGASSIEFVALLTVIHFSWTITALSLQGHYPFTDREFSPLEGRSLTVAREVLTKAGIEPLSFRVAPLGSFNAMVQGVGRYVVVVDRRAAESLTEDELRGLVGHECGHVRTGGLLPYLAVFPVVVCIVELVGVASGMPGVWIAGLGLWRFSYLAVSQSLEFYCDRFAARLASPAATASMLERIHEDLPARVRRILDRPTLAAAASHPPLAARKRALGSKDSTNLTYRLGWLISIGLVATPLVLLATPIETSGWFTIAVVLSATYYGWTTLGQFRIQRALRQSHLAFFRHPTRGRWRRRGLVVTGALTLVGIVVGSVVEESVGNALVLIAIASSFLFLLLTFAGRWAERTAGGIAALPRHARSEVIAASVALTEGKVDEALSCCERIPERYRAHPWVASIEGGALAAAGRPAEAAARTDEVLTRDPLFAPAAVVRLQVALVRNETERLRELVADLREYASHYLEVRWLCGLVAWDQRQPGGVEEALTDFREARAIKPADGGVWAAEAVVQVGEGNLETARSLLVNAEAAERNHPLVLLARAFERSSEGEHHAAATAFAAAVNRLRALGRDHWESVYRRWAERLRMTPPPVDSDGADTDEGEPTP